MNGLEAANRLTIMLAIWYLNRLCDLLERLEERGVLPTDPETVWLVRGARAFAREWTKAPELRDLQRVLTACEKQIGIDFLADYEPHPDEELGDGPPLGDEN